MSRRLLVAAAGAVFFAACGAAPRSDPKPAATPAAGSGPRIELPSGAVYAIELARTPEEQTQGLMFRESLPANTGMLFLFKVSAPHHFWMKNTMIPLDMIWLDAAGSVVFISADTPPCKGEDCPTYGPDSPAQNVLEIAGGKAAYEKITVGSTLKLEGIPK